MRALFQIILLSALGVCVAYTPALSQNGSGISAINPNRNQPLEITADQTLEWYRNDQKFIAQGNAVARQGDVRITAQTLGAAYRETGGSGLDIYRLTADRDVIITSQGNIVTGGHAVYEVDSGQAVMTGQPLKLTSPDQVVTAQDRFEYNVPEGRLTAIGGAHVVHGQDTITADRLSAFFTKGVNGENELTRLTADGNVVITTPTETLHGDHGEYVAATEIAEITGNVRIERGPNVLEGERAEVNLATSISRIHGAPSEGGRVRGVFYPGSEKTPAPEGQSTPQAQPAPQLPNTQSSGSQPLSPPETAATAPLKRMTAP